MFRAVGKFSMNDRHKSGNMLAKRRTEEPRSPKSAGRLKAVSEPSRNSWASPSPKVQVPGDYILGAQKGYYVTLGLKHLQL